jgi:hypothetical protein
MNDAVGDNKMEKFWKGFNLALLPSNFQTGFQRLSASKHKFAVPYILQLYVELFGGFFVDDLDREHLAALAGQPMEAVIESLDLLDIFYPINNGWHTSSKELRMLKVVPAYLRGIGAFFRKTSRGLKTYLEIAPKMGWLVSKWHNAALAILGRELAVKDEAAGIAK